MEALIVVFKPSTAAAIVDAAIAQVIAGGGKIGHRYESSIIGFSASMPTSLLGKSNAERLAKRWETF